MFYYQTFVRDNSYKRSEPLTYSSTLELSVGSIVRVPLKEKTVIGFIVHRVVKPNFATKPIVGRFDLPPLPKSLVELATWMLAYYLSSVGVIAQHFLPQKLSDKHHAKVTNRLRGPELSNLPPLTTDQAAAMEQINSASNTYILHGETASGKTRVYIEATAKSLAIGRSALILTPEIGLTPQLEQSFKEAFGNDTVIVSHSQLGDKERAETWLRILEASEPLVVIGPRSALFAPLKNIGLIVVDESHEPTYKQDQLPYYHATQVAARLAGLHKASLILGSATPSITDYFIATAKQKPIVRITKPARQMSANQISMEVIDIKQRSNFSRSPHLSSKLIAAIEQSLAAHEQCLLFLNRRGTARIVLCENCGWQAICQHCDLPFIYHGDKHELRCHTCGVRKPLASACPDCGHADILLKSIGTKAIVDEVTSIFPQARIARFDGDNKKSERLEQQYGQIRAGKIDIIVGTQVLAKGLDLPKLSTVGVIAADTSLYFPDYTAQERTYQLLRQVVGRAGRGHVDGVVLIQTYDPDNIILRAAIENDWDTFYNSELAERKKFLFPPFCFLLKLTCRRATQKSSERASRTLMKKLREANLRIIIDGPSPSFHEKIGNAYQWQLVIKSRDRKELLKVIELLPSGWSYNIDPIHLL